MATARSRSAMPRTPAYSPARSRTRRTLMLCLKFTTQPSMLTLAPLPSHRSLTKPLKPSQATSITALTAIMEASSRTTLNSTSLRCPSSLSNSTLSSDRSTPMSNRGGFRLCCARNRGSCPITTCLPTRRTRRFCALSFVRISARSWVSFSRSSIRSDEPY